MIQNLFFLKRISNMYMKTLDDQSSLQHLWNLLPPSKSLGSSASLVEEGLITTWTCKTYFFFLFSSLSAMSTFSLHVPRSLGQKTPGNSACPEMFVNLCTRRFNGPLAGLACRGRTIHIQYEISHTIQNEEVQRKQMTVQCT